MRIEIPDTGIGVSMDDRKLFDRLRVTKSSGDTSERMVDVEKKLAAYK